MRLRSSESSARRASTACSVGSGAPQATISSSTKPTASPAWKRPPPSSRAAGATAPVRTCSIAARIAAALAAASWPGSRATAAASPACWERVGTTTTRLSDSSATRSAAMTTLGLLGKTTISSAGAACTPASRS